MLVRPRIQTMADDSDMNNFVGPNASHERLLELRGIEAAAPSDWPSMLLKECLEGTFDSFFKPVTVTRDLPAERADVEGLPQTVIKLVTLPGVKDVLSDIQCTKHVMVRDEYIWALNDCRAACYQQKTDFQTPPECIHPKVQFRPRSVTEVPSPSPPAFSHNPFDDHLKEQDSYGEEQAFIIVGHPGVGKTALLPIILILRCLARRVTFFQTKPNEMWMFYPSLHTAYRVHVNDIMPGQLLNLLPRDAWALIDSNEYILSVPPCITSMRTFVIQASSPRAFRTEWISKRSYSPIFWYMASWTLGELICGRDFDALYKGQHPISEKNLEAFIAVCPPSARIAYSLQRKPFDFDKHVAARHVGVKISTMTLQSISRLLGDDPDFDKDDTISHHVLAVTPGPMRDIPATYIPSREMYHLLRDKLRASKAWEATFFYSLFLRNPLTKGSAGYLLEDFIHILLGKGGVWQLTELQKGNRGPKNTYWETGTTTAVLAIGHDGPLSCHILQTAPLLTPTAAAAAVPTAAAVRLTPRVTRATTATATAAAAATAPNRKRTISQVAADPSEDDSDTDRKLIRVKSKSASKKARTAGSDDQEEVEDAAAAVAPTAATATTTFPTATTCVPVRTISYNPRTTTFLVTGFYHPVSGSQPTFDAFFYDTGTKTATIFQSTVSAEHSVKSQGIEWLHACGAENFVYVALTPADVSIRFPFPNGLIDDHRIKRYQLGLAEEQVVAVGK
ncbi:hypothetical protein GGX14DRAFT_592758 [Mycena pura]|uniref:Crinkler (CRN) family protein n=1 Tax=Mycena pura TaxID=153505 RepID=A0AAD6VQ86_9AGAR|nr:hypothetical protein GGX14DRAFT_592758 [Mycena pura]